MTDNTMRSEFEEWYTSQAVFHKSHLVKLSNGYYFGAVAETAWRAWQAAKSEQVKPDYSVTQLQRLKLLMGRLGLATDGSLEAFCLDADRQLSRAITATEKTLDTLMSTQSVPVVGDYPESVSYTDYLHLAGEDWDDDYKTIWAKLQAEVETKILWRKLAKSLCSSSITAAELERLRKDAETSRKERDNIKRLLAYARDDVFEHLQYMRTSFRDSPRNQKMIERQEQLIKEIDAAIAHGKGE